MLHREIIDDLFPIKHVVSTACAQFLHPFDTHEARPALRIGRGQARYLDIKEELVDGWELNVSQKQHQTDASLQWSSMMRINR
jgi:hypothetical protein